MAQANNKREILYQNLIDAGCGEELIADCMMLAEGSNLQQMITMLKEYKENMLASVHEREKQIDCLDFLIFRLKKENN